MMFFNEVSDIQKIARRCGTAVFVIPSDVEFEIKNAFLLKPEEKNTITIEQVRGLLRQLTVRFVDDQFVIIRPAELLNTEASNALLKNLEEPGEKVHFVLITDQPSRLLATILSRASVYCLRDSVDNSNNVVAQDKIKALAKELIAAKGVDLMTVAEKITKRKDNTRAYCLDVLAIAIEMSYKAYFMTRNESFLKKIPKLLMAYDNVTQNGNVKLQLIASLV